MMATYERKSLEPPLHYHPFQEEFIEIISGEMTVRMNGELEVLGPGHQLYIAKKDRKSTRLNSSHDQISYAVFCLKKKKKEYKTLMHRHEHEWVSPSHHSNYDEESACFRRNSMIRTRLQLLVAMDPSR